MNIDDVLLTLKQVRNIRELADKIAVNHGLRGDEYLKFKDDAQDKAQCLKLLEWLVKERLIAHENYTELKESL